MHYFPVNFIHSDVHKWLLMDAHCQNSIHWNKEGGCLKIFVADPDVTSLKVAEHQPSVGYKIKETDWISAKVSQVYCKKYFRTFVSFYYYYFVYMRCVYTMELKGICHWGMLYQIWWFTGYILIFIPNNLEFKIHLNSMGGKIPRFLSFSKNRFFRCLPRKHLVWRRVWKVAARITKPFE